MELDIVKSLIKQVNIPKGITINQDINHAFAGHFNFTLNKMALRSYLLKNSQFVRVQTNDLVQFPFFSFPSLPEAIFTLDPAKTLRDLQEEIALNFPSNEITFFGIDGSKLSLTSSLFDSTMDPLNIKIGEIKMYTLYNLSISKIHLTPHQRALVQQYEKEKKLTRTEAEVIGTFNSFIYKELQEHSEEEITAETFSLMVKNALLQYGTQVLTQKHVFEAQLELLKSKYSYELEVHDEVSRKAEVSSHKAIKRFYSVIVAQFLAIQYGTYHLYSWDIMEPITCLMTMGDVCVGYLFWMLSGKREYGLEGIRSYFYDKKYNRLIRRKGISLEKMKDLLKTVKDVENRIHSI